MTRRLAIVGSATTTRVSAPWDDRAWDIWAISHWAKAKWMKRYTAIIEIHDAVLDPHPINPGYWQLLQETEVPVYMLHMDSRVKNANPYPMDLIRSHFFDRIKVNGERVDKFNSTLDYAIALALWQGYDYISFYGIDVRSEGEYAFERPGWAFWLGMALGREVTLELHSHTDLFKTIYGPKHRQYLDNGFAHVKLGELEKGQPCRETGTLKI